MERGGVMEVKKKTEYTLIISSMEYEMLIKILYDYGNSSSSELSADATVRKRIINKMEYNR